MSEEKMQIVINNYFKSECSVDTSIRQAFEKGFRIGVKKGLSAQPERKEGEWIEDEYGYIHCSECGMEWDEPEHPQTNFCPDCGAKMKGEQE